MKKKLDIKSYVQSFFSWMVVVMLIFAVLPFKGQAQTRRPIVPVFVYKYATPVSNPASLDNPNAWDITLRVATGTATPEKADIVLVFDASESMSGIRIKYAKEAAEFFVKKMLPEGENTENVRVALVVFDTDVFVESDFTKNKEFLIEKIKGIKLHSGTNTQAGLHEARMLLKESDAPQKHIVLLSDGEARLQYYPKRKDPNFFIAPGEGDDVVDLIEKQNKGNYYLKSDLQESDYNYTGGYTPAHTTYKWFEQNKKRYYLFPCNAAINEAQFAKDKGVVIHSIGLDTKNNEKATLSLKRIATTEDHYHFADPVELIDAFDEIAQTIKDGLKDGKVEDVIAPGFIIDKVGDNGGDITNLIKVSQGTVSYNASKKTISWDLGEVGKSKVAELTYRVFANVEDIQNDKGHINPFSDAVPDAGGFDTNISASLNYTNSNGEPNQKIDFPRPAVKLGYGYIKRHYVLVDKQGHPIKLDGSIVGSLSDAEVLQEEDFFLPAGEGHIAPKWIKMNKGIDDLNNQKIPVTPSKKLIEYKGETYRLVDGSVAGSTPDGGGVGISWKKPIGHAYFAYVRVKNYWKGGTSGHENAWNISSNWTDNKVPLVGEDIEFATSDNNDGDPAVTDLHLDHMPQNSTDGRVIGNLINASDKNLVITNGNQLTINGKVIDGNPSAGTIVVKASTEDAPTGTLKFAKPADNKNVDAIVEFYSKAYDCVTCGMYRRSWQYFGIPVLEADFPKNDVNGDETINQWVEPFNGNKWQTAPYRPDTKLQKFKGYEITNSSTSKPTEVYKFKGKLYVGDADVSLTKTFGVNYAGANLVGNSYTAAIHIKKALVIPNGVDKTVYLFNTGTRDQWRKLDGSTVPGYQAGQYLAVPQNTAGSGNLPDRIPSMQTFMLLANNNGASVKIKYDQLVKNTKVNKGDGTQIGLRSADENNNGEETQTVVRRLPSLQIDVMGEKSADRVWLFQQPQTTHGFDDGWDGRKITEEGIVQLYVASTDNSRFQVATVPETDNVKLGFTPDAKSGRYTFNFLLSEEMRHGSIYLHDIVTGAKIRIANGATYTFETGKEDPAVRFRLSGNAIISPNSPDESMIQVVGKDGKIEISNASEHACSVFISDSSSMLVGRMEVEGKSSKTMETSGKGVYIVRLQNAVVNDVRRVTIK